MEMVKNLFRATSRGHKYHGWLDTYHTFSFADYYDPTRMNFGALRVINDDIVKGGEGFGTHPHNNMEIVSIPLYGALEHKDSMGHISIINPGDVQVMSAGTGITHSEYNANEDKPINFFQIWVMPRERNLTPRYDQKSFNFLEANNKLAELVSPDKKGNSLWLNQDVWFYMGTFNKGYSFEYELKRKGNGVYAMVVEGEFDIDGETMHYRDGIGLADVDKVKITTMSDIGRLLLIDVTMVGF